MIKYKLNCKKCKNNFDSWFSSSKDFEKLKKKELINCHNCNSIKVEKTLMAPRVISKNFDNNLKKDLKKYKNIKNKILEYQKFIRKNFEYVGKNFTYEARSIHYNNKKINKGIYGSASINDLKELKEEGIDAQIVPWIDDNKN